MKKKQRKIAKSFAKELRSCLEAYKGELPVELSGNTARDLATWLELVARKR